MKDDVKGFDAYLDVPNRRVGDDFTRGKLKQPRLPYPTEAIDHDAINKTKDWLMKGVFARGEHSRWIAPPKMMKSALIGSAANHMAAGHPDWHGHKITRSIGVLYCALERPDLVMRRLIAEQKLMGWSDLPIRLCRKRFDLASPDAAKQLIETIQQTSKDIGQPVEVVIIDTSAKLISAHGGDEQLAKDNNIVWGNLSDVREETGVHTPVVGHLGKDASRGERGSNASLGDADVVIAITGDEVLTATVTEANDMSDGPLFSFQKRKYVFGFDEDGDEDAVWIVDPDPAPGASPAYDHGSLSPNEKTFFSILHGAGSKGLSLEEWNRQAKEAGLGRRRADLYDHRRELSDRKLVREYNGIWHVNHNS
jgi:hypothetical protein